MAIDCNPMAINSGEKNPEALGLISKHWENGVIILSQGQARSFHIWRGRMIGPQKPLPLVSRKRHPNAANLRQRQRRPPWGPWGTCDQGFANRANSCCVLCFHWHEMFKMDLTFQRSNSGALELLDLHHSNSLCISLPSLVQSPSLFVSPEVFRVLRGLSVPSNRTLHFLSKLYYHL